MCDFLISCAGGYRGSDLLQLLKLPYGSRSPEGYDFDFSWGSMAVLEDHLCDNNVRLEGKSTIAWVGDLVTDMSDAYVGKLVGSINKFRNNEHRSIETDPVFGKLNGAFAIVLADDKGFCILTDPRSFLSVYMGRDTKGPAAIGSHCDLVAAIAGSSDNVDETHVSEFLNFGTICFPNTMYANVKRFESATLFSFNYLPNGRVQSRHEAYWTVPNELEQYDENDLAEELRDSLVDAVRSRCIGSKIGVTLSGGLDSRLILSAVGHDTDCTALTFCDQMNRESRTAAKIAGCCGRQWVPMLRHQEFVGDNLQETVKLIGCKGLFAYAHMIGFADQSKSMGFNSILGGTQMDTYLKAYYAKDMLRKRQWGGLRRAKFEKVPFNFVHDVADVWKRIFTSHTTYRLYDARQTYYNRYFDASRGSTAEWLHLNPVDMMFVSWKAERRLVPLRLVPLDRKLVEFCFKCPVKLKLDNYIYLKAAGPLLGASALIPTSDKGILPLAGNLSNMVRRAKRKVGDSVSAIIASSDRAQVQHSWHDYQLYWQQSSVLKELVLQHGHHLDQFDGNLFVSPGQKLLNDPGLKWQHAFRLLQLAVWLDSIAQLQRNAIHLRRASAESPLIF